MTGEVPPQVGSLTSTPVSREGAALPANHRTARLIAIVSGLLGALLAIATPLLPVTQTTSTISWPENGTVDPVTAPLVAYYPLDITVDVPCAAVQELLEASKKLVG